MSVRQAVLDGLFIMANLGHFWGQARLVNNPIFATLAALLGISSSFASFQKWSVEKVRHLRENGSQSERHDMLQHFLQMKSAQSDTGLDGEVLIEAVNTIGAGADTTSIGMRACLYYVCTHPSIYRRLQAEIDDYFRERPGQKGIPYNDARRLTYLHAVISETTRLHPSIRYQLLRKAPENLTVDGFKIPHETPVGVTPRSQNRDRAIWGEDANDFRPERWIENEEKTRYFESVAMTFGESGPRTCVGRNIALVELHKYMAQLLYNFNVELVDQAKPWHVKAFWFTYQHGMYVRVQERNRQSG